MKKNIIKILSIIVQIILEISVAVIFFILIAYFHYLSDGIYGNSLYESTSVYKKIDDNKFDIYLTNNFIDISGSTYQNNDTMYYDSLYVYPDKSFILVSERRDLDSDRWSAYKIAEGKLKKWKGLKYVLKEFYDIKLCIIDEFIEFLSSEYPLSEVLLTLSELQPGDGMLAGLYDIEIRLIENYNIDNPKMITVWEIDYKTVVAWLEENYP